MRPGTVLAAAALLNIAFGTFYAWSVLIGPFESTLDASRAQISSVFSVAVAFFVIGMLSVPLLQGRIPPAVLAGSFCIMAAAGLFLTAASMSLPLVYIGYGVLFGSANGLSYGLALQLVNMAFSARRGLATGITVGAYALGAVGAAPLLSTMVSAVGIGSALYALATFFAVLALVIAWLLLVGRAILPRNRSSGGVKEGVGEIGTEVISRVFVVLWVGYALGAMAGLMILGHAASLIEDRGGPITAVVLAPVVISLGNALARIGAGWVSDHFPVKRILMYATGLASGALILALLLNGYTILLGALAIVGVSYGALASGYPVAVASYFGPERVSAVYGRLFTAWGVGGMAGPWIAGHFHDHYGSYDVAIALAAAAALSALLVTMALPKANQRA